MIMPDGQKNSALRLWPKPIEQILDNFEGEKTNKYRNTYTDFRFVFLNELS